jgi:hypothetical protein
MMKKLITIFLSLFFIMASVNAQCSLCTKTAQQLGEKPAKSLNKGIVYLAFAPLALGGIIYYLYRRSNHGKWDNDIDETNTTTETTAL